MKTSILKFVILFALCVAGFSASGAEMKITIYDDGRSCPGGCDAHVVFHGSHNGTSNAFAPGSSSTASEKCIKGRPCMICFDESPSSCIEVTYRGSGPPKGKFDFTPTFFSDFCSNDDLPTALDRYCNDLATAVRDAGYDTRLNCFETPEDSKCRGVMTEGQRHFDEDLPLWQACSSEGQAAFNARQPDDATRRIYDCSYSKLSLGGPNSNGNRWKLLLPAACRSGTFVGRNGLDCCAGNAFTAAGLHPECSAFHPFP